MIKSTIVGIAASGIRLATPYLYASRGETLGQLSGVLQPRGGWNHAHGRL